MIDPEYTDYKKAIHIIETENIRKSAPSKEDYKETIEMFEDFGIKCCVIPDFCTLTELLKWRKERIKQMLEI